MKRFTSIVVSKWIKNMDGIPHARKLRPFPGKTPTRIMLSSVIGSRRLTYLGKPSMTIWKKWVKFSRVPLKGLNLDDVVTMYVEFDRGGPIHLSISYVAGWRSPARKTNIKLWQYYHPEVLPEDYPNWLRWPYKVVKNTYKIA